MSSEAITLRRSPVWIVVVVLGIVTTVLLIASESQLSSVAWWATGSALAAVLVAWRIFGGVLTPIFAYLVVLVLFTLGLAPWLALGGGAVEAAAGLSTTADFRWVNLYPDLVAQGLALSLLFMWFFLLPAAVWRLVAVQVIAPVAPQWNRDEALRKGAAALGAVAVIVLCASFLVWLLNSVVQQGPLFFLGSYSTYQDTENALVPYAYLGLALGGAAAPLCRTVLLARLSYLVLGAFAVLGLPVGLRGEVLIPLVSFGVVLSLIKPIKLRWYWPVLMVIALGVVSTIQQIRLVGLGKWTVSQLGNPSYGLAEMGASLRPTTSAILWREVYGESGFGIQTYWAPFDRFIHSLLQLSQPPALQDLRLFNTLIRLRESSIGGSVVGEAYYAGGMAFLVGVALLMGAGVFAMALSPPRPYLMGASGMLLAMVLLSLRNSVTPWGLQLFAVLAMLALARVLQSLGQSKNRRVPQQRSVSSSAPRTPGSNYVAHSRSTS